MRTQFAPPACHAIYRQGGAKNLKLHIDPANYRLEDGEFIKKIEGFWSICKTVGNKIEVVTTNLHSRKKIS